MWLKGNMTSGGEDLGGYHFVKTPFVSVPQTYCSSIDNLFKLLEIIRSQNNFTKGTFSLSWLQRKLNLYLYGGLVQEGMYYPTGEYCGAEDPDSETTSNCW